MNHGGAEETSTDTQETTMNETSVDDADRAKIEADVAARRAEWDASMADYDAKWRAFRQRQADVLPGNKAALFRALAAAGVSTVVVAFDGCGDSGQIESVTAFDTEGNEVEFSETRIDITQVQFDKHETLVTPMSQREVVEWMAYDFLEQTHDGWENDDGAYGEFTFTVADQSIRLEYNERYTETNYHEHEF